MEPTKGYFPAQDCPSPSTFRHWAAVSCAPLPRDGCSHLPPSMEGPMCIPQQLPLQLPTSIRRVQPRRARPCAPILLGGTPLGLTLLLACGGTADITPPPPPPTVIVSAESTASGNGQSGTVATALPLPLRVVVDSNGSPEAGATVSWQSSSGALAPTSSVTNGEGVAAAIWTLDTVSGGQTASATVAGATGSPVKFSATA